MTPMSEQRFSTGREVIVDAYGGRPSALRSKATLEQLFARIQREMALHVIGSPMWHVFPGSGGVTGLVMLTESHLSVHTFPEHRYAALNLYCCREIAEWGWEAALNDLLGAEQVIVRSMVRGVRVDSVVTSLIARMPQALAKGQAGRDWRDPRRAAQRPERQTQSRR